VIRQILKSALLRRGMVLSRPPGQYNLLHVKLADAKRRGLELRCIVDGGAADGGWTREIKAIYPDALLLCVEPRDDVQPHLRQLAREFTGIHIAQTLLGPREGTVQFHDAGPQSSALPNSQGHSFGVTRTMPVSTLDALIADQKLSWPDLIKLDLQGYELDALAGAEQCMSHAQALLLELSFFQLQKGMPLADEVIAFLRQRQFHIYDIPALWHRPLDGALAQGDFLFLRQGHPLLADNRWSVDLEFASP